MPLKIAVGNMYDWVTHTHTHLGGECPHKCFYCYVSKNRWGRAERYTGKLRLLEHELKVYYGTGKTIFIEHMNDMFADGIKNEWIQEILSHCCQYSGNKYVFQTKNPKRVVNFLTNLPNLNNVLIGTTIETNRDISKKISQAPSPMFRMEGMTTLSSFGLRTFITIEPIMDFDVEELVDWLIDIRPEFVNIGADSKNCGLPEPSKEKVLELIEQLNKANITIKKKSNLDRIINRN